MPNGATIERELRFDFAAQSELRLSLRNPDFTTATRIAGAINAFVGAEAAAAMDPATVRLRRPASFRDMSSFIAQIEGLEIEPEQRARVIINETTGVIVMGENVRVSTVAIAQGNLTIQVQETPGVAMPNSFTNAPPVVVPQTDVAVAEDVAKLAIVGGNGVPLRELVGGLNALGVSPARPDRHPAGAEGLRRAAGRHRGDVMATRPACPSDRRAGPEEGRARTSPT